MIKTNTTQTKSRHTPLFRLGFRPFFLCAALFSCISMLIWMGVYLFRMPLTLAGLTPQLWHAHEMIFGYAFSVIAGFLLTAVSNWTGIRTLQGAPLAALVLVWLCARFILMSAHDLALTLAVLLDGAFGVCLIGSLGLPIIQAKQWKQTGVLVLVALIFTANMMFYWGVLSGSAELMDDGMYLGLYLVVGLIMIIGGRVIPSFVERGVGHATVLHRWVWADRANIILLILFVITDFFTLYQSAAFYLSAALFCLNALRVWGWYNSGIWQKPLLWVLYLSYIFIAAGFGFKSISLWLPLTQALSVHAFAYGGIGLMTLGMMARVSLGHTGRNVHDPPKPLFWMFSLLSAGALVRILMPLIDMTHYPWWILLSQVAWIGAFGMFLFIYTPILIHPRLDDRDG